MELGQIFYFHPTTLAKGKELGLDGFRFYIAGRGGVLGDAESAVVTSAFGYWNGGLIAKMWNSAKETIGPRDAGRAYFECCAEVGRAVLGGVDGLDAYNEAAETVVKAANPAGLALFAGLAAEPLADDAPGRAMQLAAVLRELRGSAHIVALLASGLAPEVAHAMKRPDMVESFGWQEAPEIGPDDPGKVEAAEELTSRLLIPAYSALGDDGEAAFIAGTEAMVAATAG